MTESNFNTDQFTDDLSDLLSDGLKDTKIKEIIGDMQFDKIFENIGQYLKIQQEINQTESQIAEDCKNGSIDKQEAISQAVDLIDKKIKAIVNVVSPNTENLPQLDNKAKGLLHAFMENPWRLMDIDPSKIKLDTEKVLDSMKANGYIDKDGDTTITIDGSTIKFSSTTDDKNEDCSQNDENNQ